jgi:hypothetical protein
VKILILHGKTTKTACVTVKLTAAPMIHFLQILSVHVTALRIVVKETLMRKEIISANVTKDIHAVLKKGTII